MTNYWLLSVALCLTGLGLGDSPLVTPSLSSLALSFVISIFSFIFFSLFFYLLSLYFFSLPYDFLHKVAFLNIYLYYGLVSSCSVALSCKEKKRLPKFLTSTYVFQL